MHIQFHKGGLNFTLTSHFSQQSGPILTNTPTKECQISHTHLSLFLHRNILILSNICHISYNVLYPNSHTLTCHISYKGMSLLTKRGPNSQKHLSHFLQRSIQILTNICHVSYTGVSWFPSHVRFLTEECRHSFMNKDRGIAHILTNLCHISGSTLTKALLSRCIGHRLTW